MWRFNLAAYPPAPRVAAGRQTPFRLVAHCWMWGLVLAILVLVVPRVEAIFMDFGIPLPRLTGLVVRASHELAWPFPAILNIPLFLLIVLGLDWLMLNAQSERGEEGWALAWSMLMFALPMLLLAVTAWAIALPFFTIMTRLSG